MSVFLSRSIAHGLKCVRWIKKVKQLLKVNWQVPYSYLFAFHHLISAQSVGPTTNYCSENRGKGSSSPGGGGGT